MLKKILSAVLSLSIVGTMFATVPAMADSKEVVDTTAIIDENFDNLEGKDLSRGDAAYANVPNTNVYYDAKVTSESSYGKLSFVTDSGTDKALQLKRYGSFQSNVWFKADSAVSLDAGDKLHISFDYKHNGKGDMFALIGDNHSIASRDWTSADNDKYLADGTKAPNRAFVPLDSSFTATDNSKSYPQFGSALAVFDANGAHLGCRAVTDTANKSKLDNWVNVDIIVNTADANANGVQTIKGTFTYADNTTVSYYGTYDANYKGTDDSSVDAMTSFTYLKFRGVTTDENQEMEYYLNNVKIEKLKTSTEYYTTSVKHLIDYDFSNVAGYTFDGSTSDKLNNIKLVEVDAENNVYFRQNYNTSSSAEVVYDSAIGKYVFKQSIKSDSTQKNKGNMLVFKNPEGSTAIQPGDIIRFSYDMKNGAVSTSAWAFRTSPLINMPAYGQYDNYGTGENYVEKDTYYLGKYGESAVVSGTNCQYKDALLIEQIASGLSRYIARTRYDGTNNNKTITTNTWHNYEFVINTADAASDGNQTMKVYIDGNDVFYGTLDVNINDTSKNAFDKFTALQMYLYGDTGIADNDCIYTTNYKLDIIKPGFGISGDAIKNNDPSNGITLNPGTMTVTCALNLPGSSSKKSEVATKAVTIYAAQYDGDQLVGISAFDKTMSEYNNTAEVDVTVKSGADTVKLFAFDADLTPLVVNAVGTVASASRQSISYSNSFDTVSVLD